MAEDKKLQDMLKKAMSTKHKQQKSFRTVARGKLCFAFDFGEYAIKIVVAKIQKNGFEIRNMIIIENDEQDTKLDKSNVKQWSSRIKREFALKNIVPNDQVAVCSVGERSCLSRQFDIPYIEDAYDRNGIAGQEMCTNLALDPDAYIFQHELLDIKETDDGRVCTVRVVAIRDEVASVYYDLIRSLKLRPYVLDVNANGVKRFAAADIEVSSASNGRTAAYIDYGMNSSDIYICRDGRLLGVSHIDNGDNRLVAEAKNFLGAQIADPKNPNKLLVQPSQIYGIINEADYNPKATAFSMVVEEWLSKINSIITRFDIENPTQKVSHIYLYGGSFQLVWLVKYVQSVTKKESSIIQKSDCFDLNSIYNAKNNAIPQFFNALNLLLMN